MSAGGSNGWSDGQMTVTSLSINSGYGVKWLVSARNSDGRTLRADIEAAWDALGENLRQGAKLVGSEGLVFEVVVEGGFVKLAVTPDDANWSWRTNAYII